jgi:hypothetical protein
MKKTNASSGIALAVSLFLLKERLTPFFKKAKKNKRYTVPFLFLAIVIGVNTIHKEPQRKEIVTKPAVAAVVYGYNSSTDECTVPSGKFTKMSKIYGDSSSVWCKGFNEANALTVQQFAKRNIPDALKNGKTYDFELHNMYDDYVVTEEEAKAAIEESSRPKSYVEQATAAFESPEMKANIRSVETGEKCEVNFNNSISCSK